MCEYELTQMPYSRNDYYYLVAPTGLWSEAIVKYLAGCGLTANMDLEHALYRIVEHADYSWAELGKASGATRLVLVRAFRIAGGNRWRQAIASLSPDSRAEKFLCILDLTYRMLGTWKSEDTWTRQACETRFPELAAGRTFLLIYSLVVAIMSSRYDSDVFSEMVTNRIRDLGRSDVQSYDPVWLRWSMESTANAPDEEPTSIDVVECLEQHLLTHVEPTDELTPEDLDQALAVLREIKEQRAALLA